MPEVLNPDKEHLEGQARKMLPRAEQIVVHECLKGRSPFKLVVGHGGRWEHTFFFPADLPLACKVVATRLGLGAR